LNITYRNIRKKDLNDNLLADFKRYQVVEYDWEKVNSQYELVHNPHIEDWNEAKKSQKVNETFKHIIKSNGLLIGAFENESLIGFAGCDSVKYGSSNHYIHLMELHVSLEHRGLGIGKALFEKCVAYGKELNAEKLYIVASSSKESQAAYKRLGCVHTSEIVQVLYDQDPDDIHMEFKLE